MARALHEATCNIIVALGVASYRSQFKNLQHAAEKKVALKVVHSMLHVAAFNDITSAIALKIGIKTCHVQHHFYAQCEHVNSHHYSPYISYDISWEKLLKHQLKIFYLW